MWNLMASVTTYKTILKNGMYLQKYSYLNSNSSKNTKLDSKLILSHRFFSGLSGMQIIAFKYSWIFMKTWEIREKTQENGVYNSAAYCSCIQNWYQINAETKLFYSG